MSRGVPCDVRCATAYLLVLVLVLLPGLATAGKPHGAESPQALVERMTAAAESGDFAEIAACIAPEERAQMAVMMVAMAGMMVAFMDMGSGMAGAIGEGMAEAFSEEGMTEEQKAELEASQKQAAEEVAAVQKRYEEILDKHGLSELMEEDEAEEEADLAQLLEGVDEIALLRDVMSFLEEIGDDAEDEAEEDGGPLDIPDEVTDIEVQGDRATARAGDEELEFVRIDGRWYFKPPDMSEGAE